ncbi:serine hydrolase [Streptomyces thermoalcalitolerans]|uniref:Beta-lactamase class A catalytic domain-containing protein n=1 Tax=Streptomyces thermoalcalitolerans TaxID=65605 RepID=A0ABP3ZRG0_9ACTN
MFFLATIPDPIGRVSGVLREAAVEAGAAGSAVMSAAVCDLGSGEGFVRGDGVHETASVVKVGILAALLLQAQDAGRRLTAQERAYAAAMIEHSDNDAASALWRSIGGADGLDAANGRFGLGNTRGGDGTLWGLTRTTATDQLVLLRQVFGGDARLGEEAQRYVQGLMSRIVAGQDWGVSAAADGSAWALKNGWLPRSTTGLWIVNSIGRVTSGGRDCLVAVLSHGHATKEQGIALVEAVAREAVSVLRGSVSPRGWKPLRS